MPDESYSAAQATLFYAGTDHAIGFAQGINFVVDAVAEPVNELGSRMPKDTKGGNISISGTIDNVWINIYLAQLVSGGLVTPNGGFKGNETTDNVDGYTEDETIGSGATATETYTAATNEYKWVVGTSGTGDSKMELQTTETIAVKRGGQYMFEIEVKHTDLSTDTDNMKIVWTPDAGSIPDTSLSLTTTKRWIRGVIDIPDADISTIQPILTMDQSLVTRANDDSWHVYNFRLYGPGNRKDVRGHKFDIVFKLTGTETVTATAVNGVLNSWAVSNSAGDTAALETVGFMAEDFKINKA